MISSATAERFSDWINPMVMKELRQGLAARTFHVAFLLIHVVMAIFLWFGLLDPSSLEALVYVIGFFLVILQPAGAINAVASERRAGSMDLVGLTDLSPWQIVWGKFCARSAITLLFLVSILPYVVLRYFAGGLDLVSDLTNLSWIVFASLVLTAAMTGFSAFDSKLLRGVIVGGMVIVGFWSSAILAFTRAFGGPVSSPSYEWLSLVCLLAAPVLFAAVMLLVGAVQLSAASGRLEARSRSLVWAMVLLGVFHMALSNFTTDEPFALFWAIAAHFIVTLQGFLRGPSPDSVRLSPLAAKPYPVYIVGRLLHTGWPFAFLNLWAMSGVLVIILLFGANVAEHPGLLWFALSPVLFLLPPLALSVIFTRFSPLFWMIVWFIVGMVVWGTAGLLESPVGRETAEFIASFSWCGIPVFRQSTTDHFWIVQGGFSFLCSMVILRALVRESFFSSVRDMEKLAARRRAAATATT